MGLVSSGQLAICAYFIQTTLKRRIIYVFNGPEPTLGALRVFHHPKNEIADGDIRTDYLSRNLCCLFTVHLKTLDKFNTTQVLPSSPLLTHPPKPSAQFCLSELGPVKKLAVLFLAELFLCFSCLLPKDNPGLNFPKTTYSCEIPS